MRFCAPCVLWGPGSQTVQAVQALVQLTGGPCPPRGPVDSRRGTLALRSRRPGWGHCLARTWPKGSPPGTWWVCWPRPHRCRSSEVCLCLASPQVSRACLWTCLERGPSCWALIRVSCPGFTVGLGGGCSQACQRCGTGLLALRPQNRGRERLPAQLTSSSRERGAGTCYL